MQKHEDLKFLQIGLVVTYKSHTAKMYHTKQLLRQNFFGGYECNFGTMMRKILKSSNQLPTDNWLHSPFFTTFMAGHGSCEYLSLLCEF